MDYAGTTGKEMPMGYNEWGALTTDEARGISAVTYDNLGNPPQVSFSSPKGSYARYVYSATGERLKATHYTKPMIQEGVIDANSFNNSDRLNNTEFASSESASSGSIYTDIVGMTKIEYHGPVIYRNGKIDMVRFPGGYATVNGSAVTFHYYTQDYLGCNRAVINGSTGAIEQTIAYYPYGSVIADLGTDTTGQSFKFGSKDLVTDNNPVNIVNFIGIIWG